MKFFIGTTNHNKVREFGSILAATGCELEQISWVDPEETEDDFEGNALIKARAYARASGGITIAEDSGLIIPALGNLPGPWSARFAECIIDRKNWRVLKHQPNTAPSGTINQLNNELVLDLMRGIEQPRRAASFKVVLVVATPSGEILCKAVGESHGWIAEEMRGTNGFGYDPIFVGGDTFGKTYAELDAMRKNLRSHRKHVLDEFKAWLSRYLRE